MACLVLTSCTDNNTTVLTTIAETSPTLLPYVGQHVSVIGYPEVCFYVELIDNPCLDCTKTDSILPIQGNPVCQCTIPFVAYILTPCEGSNFPTVYTTQNLYPYVGSTITFFGQAGACYTVTGSLNIPQGINAIIVECPIACQCTPVVCGCPDGYVLNDNNECVGTLNVDPIVNPNTLLIGPALPSPCYWGIKGALFYPDITSMAFPLVSSGGGISTFQCVPTIAPTATSTTLTDASSNILIPTNIVTNSVWGWVYNGGRLNNIGIASNPLSAAYNHWAGISFCQNIPETKTYYIGIAGDDFYKLFINSQLIVDHSTGFAFLDWKIFPITLNAGSNFIEIRYFDTGVNSGLGFEIYDATLSQLLNVTTANNTPGPNDLNQYIIFSTKDKISQNFNIGDNSGYTCPDGYTLNICDGITCTQIVTVPQVSCKAWQITFCEGTGLNPIITNTDLSQYIGGVYSITYTIPHEPSPIIVTGCGTVEQAPSQSAPVFNGTFSEIIYDCCESCMATCYLLTDCQEAVPSMILCTDLSAHVGKVIKIKGCGNICWQVSVADSCVGSIKFEGEITEFNTCLECLPPIPPPVPLELNLRKVKPGYNSPNSCVTLEYLQKVNCTFAQQVYNEMLIKRYGITVCCEQDVDTWDIKKSELDYMLMGDPSMCKSTICDCKAPCLIDATFELVPTCIAPILISATLDNLCYPPILIDAEIVVETPCFCYTLTGSNYTVEWLDCCCKPQSTTFTSNATVCAQALPIVTEGSAVVQLAGACGSEECVATPPVCNCWTITPSKFGITSLSYTTCDNIPVVINTIGYETTLEICSPTTPIIVGEGSANVNGFCNLDCGVVPNANCLCYIINVTSNDLSTANIVLKTLNCNSNTVVTTAWTSADGPLYICSKAAPRVSSGSANAEVNMTINYSLDCSIGECVAP